MGEKRVVFNGVNDRSGTYGLPPMTVGELEGHILGSAGEPDGEQVQLRNRLKKETAKRIEPLVRLLVESNLRAGDGTTVRGQDWLGRLAELLAEMLFEAEGDRQSQVGTIRTRLQSHTVEKIVVVVELVALGETDKLRHWLFDDRDEAADDGASLKAKLKEEAGLRFGDVQTGPLAKGREVELEAEIAARQRWHKELIDGLYLVPIDALNALPETERKFKALRLLVKKLDALAEATTLPVPWLENLRAELGKKVEERRSSWNEVLGSLDRGLKDRIDVQEDIISWADLLATLRDWFKDLRRPLATYGTVERVEDPADLAQAGWGIIFPYKDDAAGQARVSAIEEKLNPLLELRKEQAGKYFKIYRDKEGYWPDDTARTFLSQYDATPDQPADPDLVPYYLLIVGSPEEIPFHFQYQLDVQYAVGRIDFGDDLEAYANYARSVVAAERKEFTLPPGVAFFGPANPGDTMTGLSVEHLIRPLHQDLKKRYKDWQFATALQDEATRPRLARLISGEETPALLFAACHGLEFDQDDDRQERFQGALLCQEWKGPVDGAGQDLRGSYLAGQDLGAEVNLLGMIAFFFACYSAGTPRYDEFYKREFREQGKTIAARPFLAALPRAMLSRPKGGALAVVGHIERVWGSSFLDERDQEQVAVFQSAVERLLKGQPIGMAMEYLNGRYAALSTELNQTIQRKQARQRIDPYELARLWTTNNDARGYIIVGDPAVRLPVAQPLAAATGRIDLSQ